MAGPYGDQLGGGTSPGPYGPQTNARTRRTIKRPSMYGQNASVQEMRTKLRAAGYHVDPRGAQTSRLLSAWAHYNSEFGGPAGGGAKLWNKNHPLPASSAATLKAAKPVQGVAKQIVGIFGGKKKASNKPVADQVKAATKKAGKQTSTHTAAKNASKAIGAGAASGMPSIPGLSTPNVNKAIPTSQADVIAGLQYDPQIKTLLTQVAQGKRDAAQHLADIGAWYGQVGKAQQGAAAQDTAAADSARGSLSNEINSIVQSLGGSRGAGVVGAQGLADLTDLAAQGANQQQYNADLGPILANEQADQSARQQALASQAAQALNTQLVEAQGARGQAKSKALTDILTANNQVRQQNFANRLSLANLAAAGAMTGLKTANLISQINERNKRTATMGKTKAAGKGFVPWLQMQSGQRQAAINSNLAPFLGSASELLPGADPNAVKNKVRAALRSQGFSSAVRAGRVGPGIDPRARDSILAGLNAAIDAAVARRQIKLPAGQNA